MFHFLCDHLDKTYTPARWAELVGIQIIDADGWRGKGSQDFATPVSLTEFVTRAKQCTIMPVRQ